MTSGIGANSGLSGSDAVSKPMRHADLAAILARWLPAQSAVRGRRDGEPARLTGAA